jgi:hypothetical protein
MALEKSYQLVDIHNQNFSELSWSRAFVEMCEAMRREYVFTEWRTFAPWSTDAQVEQDLILSRALVEIFSNPLLSKSLAFRGGTALHKLFIKPAARYSGDIDLVQVNGRSNWYNF